MIKIKEISKVLIILIFIQLSSTVFAASQCVELPGFPPTAIIGYNPPDSSEHVVLLNFSNIKNKDLNFVKINSDDLACANKKIILDINNSITINLTGNKINQYIGGVDEIRLYSDINIIVDNQDLLGITEVNFDVPDVKVISENKKIRLTDYGNRESRNFSSENGYNILKLKFQKLTILENADLNIIIVGDFPTYGSGTDVWLEATNIENHGNLDIKLNGGKGGYYGNGGSVYDLNISKIINKGFFKLDEHGGVKGHTGRFYGDNLRGGNVGSINIDYLYNASPNFEIKTVLMAFRISELSSYRCGCSNNCDLTPNPRIGDINIKYLASGSFLPKKLEIIKRVPVNETNINISGCHINSLGNSEISYIANNLKLELANLATIQNDFDSSSYQIDSVDLSEIECPVCDGLELDNSTLRTDTIYTIYTDVATNGNIVDLNIYYVNPDGNLFKPPGYPVNQNYLVYSLIPGETINPAGSSRFSSNGITEYKISKDKLYYNPEAIELNDLSPGIHGYGRDDVRLFCQGQRYLLRFRFESDPAIKEIYFTPIFDID